MPEDTPYDPYIPSGSTPRVGGSTPQQGGQTPGQDFAKIQAEIADTQEAMRSNIDELYKRGGNLAEVNDKADRLAHQSNMFRKGANQVRKQMWWKDVKMRICLGVGIVILIIVIVVPIAVTVGK